MKKNIRRIEEKMSPQALYKIAYDIIGNKTPLKNADCGKLCHGICCEGDEDTGMYLYPFEDRCYEKKNAWYRLIDSDFVYDDYRVKILTCEGKCEREERPLACRIFPLAPYRKSKQAPLEIIVDPRSYGLCPLAKGEMASYMDKDFFKRVKKAMLFLESYSPISRFIEEMSYQMDEYRRFLR